MLTAWYWQGIGFGNDGYLTLSGEYEDRKPTSRGDFDPRIGATRVTSRFGDAEVEQATVFANAGVGGAQGFPGFSSLNAVSIRRSASTAVIFTPALD